MSRGAGWRLPPNTPFVAGSEGSSGSICEAKVARLIRPSSPTSCHAQTAFDARALITRVTTPLSEYGPIGTDLACLRPPSWPNPSPLVTRCVLRLAALQPRENPASQPETTVNTRNCSAQEHAGQDWLQSETAGQRATLIRTSNPRVGGSNPSGRANRCRAPGDACHSGVI